MKYVCVFIVFIGLLFSCPFFFALPALDADEYCRTTNLMMPGDSLTVKDRINDVEGELLKEDNDNSDEQTYSFNGESTTIKQGQMEDVGGFYMNWMSGEYICIVYQDNGKPIPYRYKGRCSDSDDGVDEYNKGKLEGYFYGSKEDECIDSETLLEYSCAIDEEQNYYIEVDHINCKFGCSYGVCLKESDNKDDVEEFIIKETTFCLDHENGQNEYNKSDILIRRGIPKFEKIYDQCLDGETLKEYYCNNNKEEYEEVFCEFGCMDGACRKERITQEVIPVSERNDCSDSDGGFDFFIKGTLGSDSTTDACQVKSLNKDGGGKTLKEYFCHYNEYFDKMLGGNYDRYCLNGCQDGACALESYEDDISCTDALIDFDDCVYFCRKNSDDVTELLKGNICSCENFKADYPRDEIKSSACVKSCIDTDDKDYYTKGKIQAGGLYVRTDECLKDSVYEYYCLDENTIMVDIHECESGCSDGKCLISEEATQEENVILEESESIDPCLDLDCDDSNPCTNDSCSKGICINQKTEGCIAGDLCLPVGREYDNMICSKDGEFVNENSEGKSCVIDSECDSMPCVGGVCKKASVGDFFSWVFKAIFG